MPSLLWGAIILAASLISSSSVPKVTIPHLDKVVHFFIYFIFSWTICFAFQKQLKNLPLSKLVLAIIIATSYGVFMEYLQSIVKTGRSAELADAIFNCIGAISSASIFNKSLSLLNKLSNKL